jgi:hypothetical protein
LHEDERISESLASDMDDADEESPLEEEEEELPPYPPPLAKPQSPKKMKPALDSN